MPRKERKKTLPLPEDVLAGRVRARYQELFALIHAVNPTSRELDPSARAEAYRIKAALQSLLIEQYGDELVVDPSLAAPEDLAALWPEADVVVGLRHRSGVRDACHVPLGALTATARAWALRQLDRASDSVPERTTTAAALPTNAAPAHSALAAIARGDEALAAYEYDAAEAHYRQALSSPEANADPALRRLALRSLLVLQVEHLCQDEQALAERAAHGEALQQDPELRALWAQSAARLGRDLEAARLLRGLTGEASAAARLAVAEQALARGDLESCAELLEEVPGTGELTAARQVVADALAAARVARARDWALGLESALQALRAGKSAPADTVALTERILALDPENETALECARRERARQAAAGHERLLAELRQTIAQRNLERARALCRELEAQGVDPGALRAELEQLEGERASETAAQRREALFALLRSEPDARAVRSFWELDVAADEALLREAAVGLDPRQQRLWAWIVDAGPVQAASKCEQQLQLAHLLMEVEDALAAHERAPAEGHADAAERLWLAKGPVAFDRIGPRAEALLRELQQAAGRERAAAAEEAWSRTRVEAERRLAQSAPAEELLRALEDLRQIERSALPASAREELTELEMRLAHAESVTRTRERFDRECADRRYFAARATAQELLSLSGSDDERALATELVREAQERIRTGWIEDFGHGREVDFDAWSPVAGPQDFVPESGRIVRVRTQLGRLSLRVQSLSGESRAALFRPPEPFDALGAACGEGDEILVVGKQGVLRLLLTADAPGCELIDFTAWARTSELAASLAASLDTQAGVIWAVRQRDGGRQVAVFEMRTGKLLSDWVQMTSGVRLDEECYAVVPWPNQWQLRDPRGRLLGQHSESQVIVGLTCAPRHGEYLVLRYLPVPTNEGGGLVLELARIDAQCRILGLQSLYRTDREYRQDALGSVGMDREQGLLFVHVVRENGESKLTAYREIEGRWESRWEIQLAGRLRLCSASGGRGVLAEVNDGECLHLLRLGASAPVLSDDLLPPEPLPDLGYLSPCDFAGKRLRARRKAFDATLPLHANADLRTAVDRLLAAEMGAEELTALLTCKLPHAAREAATAALERRSGEEATAALLFADRDVRNGEYEAALRRLDACPVSAFEPSEKKHAGHLRVLALLALGQAEEAARIGRRTARIDEGDCGLAALTEFAAACALPLTKLGKRAARGASIEAVVARLRQADAAWESGDLAAALHWIEHPAIWQLSQPDALGRIVRVRLALEPEPRAGRFRTREVAAQFLASFAFRYGLGLDLGPLALPAAERQRVADLAAAWLGDDEARRVAESVSQAPRFMTVPERDPLYADPGPVGEARLLPRFRPMKGRVLESAEDRERLSRAKPLLRRCLRATSGEYTWRHQIGLLFDRAAPGAEAWSRVAWAFAPDVQQEDVAVLAVTQAAALELLDDWPNVAAEFWQSHTEPAPGRKTWSILFVRAEGACWDRVAI